MVHGSGGWSLDEGIAFSIYLDICDLSDAEARALVDTLIGLEMLSDSGDGRLGLPDDLMLTPQHKLARVVTGWRFTPRLIQGGRG
jgi:hypothetical protein